MLSNGNGRKRKAVACGDVELPERILSALPLLLQAYEYAHVLERDLWDFALEIWHLSDAGLTTSDIRWLVCDNYLEHAQETTENNCVARTFVPCSKLSFTRRSCFVLTGQGVLLARRIDADDALRRNGDWKK